MLLGQYLDNLYRLEFQDNLVENFENVDRISYQRNIEESRAFLEVELTFTPSYGYTSLKFKIDESELLKLSGYNIMKDYIKSIAYDYILEIDKTK